MKIKEGLEYHLIKISNAYPDVYIIIFKSTGKVLNIISPQGEWKSKPEWVTMVFLIAENFWKLTIPIVSGGVKQLELSYTE